MTNLFISDFYDPMEFQYGFTIDGLHGIPAHTLTSLEYIQDINSDSIELVFSVNSTYSYLLVGVLNMFNSRKDNNISFIRKCDKYLVRCSYKSEHLSIGSIESKNNISYLVINLYGVTNIKKGECI